MQYFHSVAVSYVEMEPHSRSHRFLTYSLCLICRIVSYIFITQMIKYYFHTAVIHVYLYFTNVCLSSSVGILHD